MSWKNRVEADSWKARVEDDVPEYDEMDSALRGAAQGASLGFSDEIAGGLEALYEKAKGSDRELKDLYQQSRDESRRLNQYAAAQNPDSYMGGEFTGGLASSFIPGLGIAKGAKLAGTVGKAALQGSLMGIGASEKENLAGLAEDAKSGAIIGAGGGALGHVLGSVADNIARSNFVKKMLMRGSDETQGIAERLAARSVGAERGTIKKIGGDKVQQAGRYALDEGLITPFANADELIERNKLVQDKAGKAMSDVYNKIDSQGIRLFDPMNVADQVEGQLGGFWRSPINAGETAQLDRMLESIRMRGGKEGADKLSLKAAQELKEEIGKVAKWKNNVVVSDKEQMARDAYGIINKAIDDAVETGAEVVQVPGLKETLGQAKDRYSKSKVVEELLQNKYAREQGNRLVGLTDNIYGANTIQGGAGVFAPVMLAKKAIDRYGTNVGSLGADKLSTMLKNAPEKLGKYSGVLQQAAARGTSSLGAASYILQQKDPEFRKQMRGDEEEDRP